MVKESQNVQHENIIDPFDENPEPDCQKQQQTIDDWNNTFANFPQTKTLHQIFQEESIRSPDKIAVICKETKLTYQDLNDRSNQLAHYLQSVIDIQPDDLIALFLDKTELTIISILGVWKSGGAYVPIDPSYPDERIKFILGDTQAKAIVANHHYANRLNQLIESNNKIKIVDAESFDIPKAIKNPTSTVTSSHLAYVTYTSGTTGIPKGVMKEHKSVVNSILDLASKYKIREGSEVIVLFSTYVFEPFLRQMLMALLNSQTLVIATDDDKQDPLGFSQFLKRHKVTYLNGTASVLQQYDYSDCRTLTKLLFAGEELTQGCYKKIRQTFKGTIINEYGPTESTFVTAFTKYENDEARSNRSIGKLMQNVKCYVLNKYQQQVPIGKTGELFIGGVGVSRGYLNRPDLTVDRFLPNPFRTQQEKLVGTNTRIYKTGDLARWLPNGDLEYLGRNDTQVKINGIRIEPGEIESHLSTCPGVKQCVVAAKQAKNADHLATSKYLVGYYVADGKVELVESDMLAYLQTKLPKQMIPIRLLQIKNIPVTINGKLDTKALPDIDFLCANTKKIDPRNGMELELRQMWSEILDLPVEQLSITDDFFRMGGDSIKSIQLIGQIRKRLDANVSLSDIFTLKNIQNLADHLANEKTKQKLKTQQASLKAYVPQLPVQESGNNIEAFYLANSMQQGLMYHYLKQNDKDDAYIVQSVYQYKTDIQIHQLQTAWECAMKKYSSLRLRFTASDKEVIQIVDRQQKLDWRFVDISDDNIVEQEQVIGQLQKDDRKEKYQLEKGNLFRIYLVQQNTTLFTFLFSCHHIILDGWSFPILYDYVHKTYLQLIRGEPINVIPDSSYGLAQMYLQAHRDDNIDYWTQQIDRIVERCDLSSLLKPEDKNKVQLNNYDHVKDQQEKMITIKGELYDKLKETCSANGITLHSVLQFVWHRLLSVYGNSKQTVVGTLVSGRNIPIDNVENSIGLFINTLPLIVDHEDHKGKTIINAIKDIQMQVNTINTRTHVELNRLNKGEMKHNLFDSLFVLENYATLNKNDAQSQKELLQIEAKYNVEKLDYPLAVMAREVDATVNFTLLYAGELFEENVIDQLLSVVNELLRQIVYNHEQLVVDLEFITPMEKRILEKWNETEAEFPSSKMLHQIFEEMAEKYPEKVAVVFEENKLTYRKLNEQANRLAHYLRFATDIKPDTLIALFLDKSELMIITILGVWKSGAAYVPIDPSYVDKRIQFILEDTKTKMVIANERYAPRLQQLLDDRMNILEIEELCTRSYSNTEAQNPIPISTSKDLAYVIYTSGTTGNPKGVMVEHVGVVNLQVSLAETFSLNKNQNEVILSFSNFVFDHFVEQMIDALLNGQTLVVLNDEMRVNKQRLYYYMTKNKVTYLSGTPSVLQLYEYDKFDHSITRIDAVGEDFSETVFNKMRSTFDGLIINGYGPTEVSITSHKRLYPFNEKRNNKSIGTQVSNTTCYVLNNDMKRVPIGAVGELFLGGIGVARGYLNRPELTADRFLSNPFQTEKEKLEGRNARIYKTGDLVRWLPNGEIEYLGRNDFQVKIRGLRIELGEIEAVLSSFPNVKQAVVVAKDHTFKNDKDGSTSSKKYLIGYYVSNDILTEADIKKFMRTQLPEYMIPNRLVRIDSVLVTISGKLDTKSLPEIQFSNGSDEYVAPKNEIQIKLCQIWSELLGVPADSIGINDDFFSLGGDSLMVQRLFFKISNFLSRDFTVASIFQHRTIEAMSSYILNGADSLQVIEHSINRDAVVSFAQERLLFINEYEGGTNAYNISMHLELPSYVSKTILKKSLRSMVRRHEILRTLFVHQKMNSVHLQRLLGADEAESMFLIDTIAVDNTEQLDRKLINASKYIFDLRSELPIKVNFYENAANNATFVVSIVVHHICFDGWSWKIFQKDLESFYRLHYNSSSSAATDLTLSALGVQYKDFAVWQRSTLNETRLQKLLDFWLPKLDGYEALQLTPDFPRPVQFDYSGKDIHFELDNEVANNLKALAMDLKVSLFSLLVSAYCLALSIYSNQKDIVVGIPVANRNRPELENMIGFFVNMLVLRLKVDPTSSAISYIQTVNEEVIQAQIHQEMPFEKLVKALKIPRDPSRHPIVQVVFSLDPFEATPISTSANEDPSNLKMSNYYPDNNKDDRVAKYDMSTTISECAIGMKGHFNYCTKLFTDHTIQGVVGSFTHILKQFSRMSKEDNRQLVDIECINQSGLEKLTAPTIQHSLSNKTLHQIFEEEVKTSPNKVAVVYKGTTLSYKELNQRSNQLAHFLQSARSVKPNSLTALFLDKNELMIISILGVWKSGAAYVPIDPSYPDERIQFILEDTKAETIITNRQYVSRLNALKNESVLTLEIDNPDTIELLSKQPNVNCQSDADKSSLAYVIYTSGTTGKPKGVLIEHEGVVNLRDDLIARYFGAEDNPSQQQAILFLSNYVFDFSIEQFVLSILNSNKLILVNSNWPIDDNFYDYLNFNGLTYLSGTPTYLQQFDLKKLKHLQILTVAGEAFTQSHFDKFRKEFDGTLNNAYGITETSVYNMVCRFERDDKFKNTLGQLLSNTKQFVLNGNLKLLPPGAVGELYLAGNCVARGYLNRDELTAQRFLPNPFQTAEEKKLGQFARMYKSGDLVRYTSDGQLEYRGRNDLQVKINGLRIELREIELVLLSFPGVKQCAVLAKNLQNDSTSGHKRLVGYVVSQDNDNIDEDEIKAFLQTKLPTYMIPTRLVRIDDQLPTTINGKLDTRSLPEVDLSADKEDYTAPRNSIEKELCQIWSELLGIPNVGIDDDFFRLGGDSVLSLQLSGRIRHTFNMPISVKDIFVFKSIRRLFDNVLDDHSTTHVKTINVHAEQGILSGDLAMLPVQEWFFSKNLANCNHWNQSFAIRTPQLDLQKLNSALAKLIEHHDAFRLRFKKDNGKFVQFYEPAATTFKLETFNIESNQNLEEVLTQRQSQIDIENGPIFRVSYLDGYADGSSRVWFAMHHLIVDTVSWRIICQDLQTLYNGGGLGCKGSSYRQWTKAVKTYSNSSNEQVFWKTLATKTESFNQKILPFVKSETPVRTSFTLTIEQTEGLLRRCNQAYDARINDLLLTALAYAIKNLTQDRINYVTVEGHGREEIDGTLDVSRTIGWFTTMYPVELTIGDNITSSVENVKNYLNLVVPNKGIGYGPIVGYSKSLPRISFNYLGQFDSNSKKAWTLADVTGEYEADRSAESQEADDDVIGVTGLCSNGQLQFKIASRLDYQETEQFSLVFQSKLEEIIKNADNIIGDHSKTKTDAMDKFEPYVEFCGQSNDKILFVLPPGEGGAESYFNNIVQHLPSLRLILFNNYYLHTKKVPTTFEELAKFYIKFVKQVQPQGPYNFLGWSFGGVLALEISRQLIKAGEKVDNLISIDSYFNVQKASCDIGQTGNVIDRINYLYSNSRKSEDFEKLAAKTNVVLFRAKKMNDMYKTTEEKVFYEYYMRSECNNLETLVDRRSIRLVSMEDDSHLSWINNKQLLTTMADYIMSLL